MTTSKYIAMASQAVLTRDHEHSWEIQSTHNTSIGIVHYLKCRSCFVRQMILLRVSDISTLSSKEITVLDASN